MNHRTLLSPLPAIFYWLLAISATGSLAASGAAERQTPWTTSMVIGSPEPPSPYQPVRVFPNVRFKDPVDFANAPGSDRLFVLELRGQILSFDRTRTDAGTALAIDLAKAVPGFREAYGITFHPGFQTNRTVFVCYVLKENLPDGSRVSRFKMTETETNSPRIDPASEEIIITWLSGGHNGGCLKFGPDGFLYITTGDGAGPNPPDPLNTGQDNSDLLSSILRIDVEQKDDGKNYRVPNDNPFVGRADCRPEIWSYGFRNPWKMAFDPKTGYLWTADVGWELWELVYRVERGGNYGWSVVEGRQPVKPDGKRGPTPILPPVMDHAHSEAASITGGYVYRGKRLPDLVGAYIYGDYETGKIWALRYDGASVTSLKELADTPHKIVTFGEDNLGELYYVGYDGLIFQLEPTRITGSDLEFPRKLSETGLFTSVRDRLPAPGVQPYAVQAGLWSDHAEAERWIAVPGQEQVRLSDGRFQFPLNTVFARTLSIETTPGKPASRRTIETQLLHFNGNAWQGYAYAWNDAQTDAALVDAAGAAKEFEIRDPTMPGGVRKQSWRFASRSECMRCHNSWSGFALGFNLLQLPASSPELVSSDSRALLGRADGLRELQQSGVIAGVPGRNSRRTLANPHAAGAELGERARSWLHVNCAHCHREGAGGSVVSHFNYELRLADMKSIDRRPSQGDFGIEPASVIAPGDPFRSVLYYRIAKLGAGRMPHLGSTVVDVRGVNLVHDWIASLDSKPVTNSSAAVVPVTLPADAKETLRSTAATAAERARIIQQALAGTSSALAWLNEVNRGQLPASARDEFIAAGLAHSDLRIRDLFERFLPEEQRTKRLGPSFPPETVLALPGDAGRGRLIFFQEGGLQCHQCHRVGGKGRSFGPDLDQIGKKYERAGLLDHILHPSKLIDPIFALTEVETSDDLTFAGFLVKRSPEEVVLKDANLKEVRFPSANVRRVKASAVSAMPEGLLQTLTAQEAADLLEFLRTLQ